MEKRLVSTSDDDLDLRTYLEKIFRGWKIFLATALVAALPAAAVSLLLPPTYEATAVLSIPSYAAGETAVATLLMSDGILEAVQARPGIAPDVDSRVELTVERDQLTCRITARAPEGDQAALEANAWAEESIKWIRQSIGSADRSWLKKTRDDLTQADRALLEFLDRQGLGGYSLIDLRYYEGMISPNDFNYIPAAVGPNLGVSVREELRQLLRDQANAANLFSDAQDRYNKHQLQLQTNSPEILSSAQPPNHPIHPQPMFTFRNTALAAFFGAIAGMLFILAQEWWKAPAAAEVKP